MADNQDEQTVMDTSEPQDKTPLPAPTAALDAPQMTPFTGSGTGQAVVTGEDDPESSKEPEDDRAF